MAAPELKMAIGNAASTTASSSMTNVQTTTPLTSTTNFQAATTPGEGLILIDEGAATEEITYATGVSGGNLTTPLANRGLEGGSAQAHSSGASIKGILTAGMWNDLIDALVNTLFTQSTGALKSGIAMTSPVFTTPQIQDSSSDHKYIFAVNELTADRTVTLPLLTGNDDFVFEDHTQTMTNKRITKRITTITTHATPTINTDNCDCVTITAQGEAITSMTTNLTGTPTNFQTLVFRILDNGTGRAITWGASFEARGVALPTTTTANKLLTVGFIYDSVDAKWGCVASVTEV